MRPKYNLYKMPLDETQVQLYYMPVDDETQVQLLLYACTWWDPSTTLTICL